MDPALHYRNNAYSFLRELSTSDHKWAIGTFVSNSEDMSVAGLRKQIDIANDTYGFYRKTLSNHIVALDDNNDFAWFTCSYAGVALADTRLITLNDFCDGNTTEEGDLYAIPLRVVFPNIACDIKEYQDPSTNGSSYISKDMADGIIASVSGINSYRDLLGKVYQLGSGTFTINNIFYPTVSQAPLLNKYYGKFIITDSSAFMNQFHMGLTASYQADTISQDDYVRFYQRNSTEVLKFTYYKKGIAIENDYTRFMKSTIENNSPTKMAAGPLFWVSLVLLVGNVVVLWYLIHDKLISKKTLLIALAIFGAILIAVAIANYAFYSSVVALDIFNLYLSAFAIVNIASLLILPFFKTRKSRRRLDSYEADI